MRTKVAIWSLLFSVALLIFPHAAFAQFSVGISVGFAPPPIPVYEQPICPGADYIWTPGYWAYDDADGYYWVPGTWIEAPQVGYLWTPGYWGWGGSAFFFHEGYWGPRVGFYGGINYGFGYGGNGYDGGRWEGGHFSYNTYVNRVNTTIIHNTYNTRVTNITNNRVSYNGGRGGINARATSQEESYARERHVGPVAEQTQHAQTARGNPQSRASVNHGKPSIAATARPGDFKTGAVASRQAGGEYKAPPAVTDANQLRSHTFNPPNTGDAATDKKYQQEQNKLGAQQAQDHQRLQQQQEQEHQQAAKNNYNNAQRQQMEQHHTQQTQQLEQQHSNQQRQMEQRQAPAPHQSAPHQSAPRPESHPSGGKPH